MESSTPGAQQLDQRVGEGNRPLLLMVRGEPEVDFSGDKEGLCLAIVSLGDESDLLFPASGKEEELDHPRVPRCRQPRAGNRSRLQSTGDHLLGVARPILFAQRPYQP
jgi:hypothetical protein